MICDAATGMVLALNRVKLKLWCGYSFPGGHIEKGESFWESAVREAKEETGLDVKSLKSCGVIHWVNTVNDDRYITFLYKTSDFSGELLDKTEEGANVWKSVDELFAAKSENGLHEILRMFLTDEYSEAFGSWSNDNDWKIDKFL
jgi:8-oxo-dGTP diphosphatase